jgi:hypothetical protein
MIRDAMYVGPHQDLRDDLREAIKRVNSPIAGSNRLKFGVYHILLEFFHPSYLQDNANRSTLLQRRIIWISLRKISTIWWKCLVGLSRLAIH